MTEAMKVHYRYHCVSHPDAQTEAETEKPVHFHDSQPCKDADFAFYFVGSQILLTCLNCHNDSFVTNCNVCKCCLPLQSFIAKHYENACTFLKATAKEEGHLEQPTTHETGRLYPSNNARQQQRGSATNAANDPARSVLNQSNSFVEPAAPGPSFLSHRTSISNTPTDLIPIVKERKSVREYYSAAVSDGHEAANAQNSNSHSKTTTDRFHKINAKDKYNKSNNVDLTQDGDEEGRPDPVTQDEEGLAYQGGEHDDDVGDSHSERDIEDDNDEYCDEGSRMDRVGQFSDGKSSRDPGERSKPNVSGQTFDSPSGTRQRSREMPDEFAAPADSSDLLGQAMTSVTFDENESPPSVNTLVYRGKMSTGILHGRQATTKHRNDYHDDVQAGASLPTGRTTEDSSHPFGETESVRTDPITNIPSATRYKGASNASLDPVKRNFASNDWNANSDHIQSNSSLTVDTHGKTHVNSHGKSQGGQGGNVEGNQIVQRMAAAAKLMAQRAAAKLLRSPNETSSGLSSGGIPPQIGSLQAAHSQKRKAPSVKEKLPDSGKSRETTKPSKSHQKTSVLRPEQKRLRISGFLDSSDSDNFVPQSMRYKPAVESSVQQSRKRDKEDTTKPSKSHKQPNVLRREQKRSRLAGYESSDSDNFVPQIMRYKPADESSVQQRQRTGSDEEYASNDE
jgi:hypothetical protein